MIRTEYTAGRLLPWEAWEDAFADEAEAPVGLGRTEAEAIADLRAWTATEMEDDA